MTTFTLSRLSIPWHQWGAFALWLGAAASAAYWFLQFPSGQSAPTPALAQSADGAAPAVSFTQVARVLGVQAPAPEVTQDEIDRLINFLDGRCWTKRKDIEAALQA